jgi:hypothetical protein
MKLTSLPLAGGGGRKVYVNPEQVVCVLDMGENRAQVVTTGLSGESSMSILVSMAPEAVLEELGAGPGR